MLAWEVGGAEDRLRMEKRERPGAVVGTPSLATAEGAVVLIFKKALETCSSLRIMSTQVLQRFRAGFLVRQPRPFKKVIF